MLPILSLYFSFSRSPFLIFVASACLIWFYYHPIDTSLTVRRCPVKDAVFIRSRASKRAVFHVCRIEDGERRLDWAHSARNHAALIDVPRSRSRKRVRRLQRSLHSHSHHKLWLRRNNTHSHRWENKRVASPMVTLRYTTHLVGKYNLFQKIEAPALHRPCRPSHSTSPAWWLISLGKERSDEGP